MQVKLNSGRPSVIITGRAGVGKSVLAAHYHGEANTQDWNEPGTSTDVEIKPITIGEWTKIVAVIPGQNTKERARALDEALNKANKLDGVIHVVDWGFTSIRDSAVRKEMVESKGLDSIEKIRAHNLALELKDFELMLDKLAMSISNNRGPEWLVIAVNKVDLFENRLLTAEQYYNPSCTSEFTDKM
ncbi:GTPase domain-containing protein [Rheinheimera salexigens]